MENIKNLSTQACEEWYEKCTIVKCSEKNQEELRRIGATAFNKFNKKYNYPLQLKNVGDCWSLFETHLILKPFVKKGKNEIGGRAGTIDVDEISSLNNDEENIDEKNGVKVYKTKMAASRNCKDFAGYISTTFRDVVRVLVCQNRSDVDSKGKKTKTKEGESKFSSYDENILLNPSPDGFNRRSDEDLDNFTASMEDRDARGESSFSSEQTFDPNSKEDCLYLEDYNSDFEEEDSDFEEEDSVFKEEDSNFEEEGFDFEEEGSDFEEEGSDFEEDYSYIEKKPSVAAILKEIEVWLNKKENKKFLEAMTSQVRVGLDWQDVTKSPEKFGLDRKKSALYEAKNQLEPLINKLRRIVPEEEFVYLIKKYLIF